MNGMPPRVTTPRNMEHHHAKNGIFDLEGVPKDVVSLRESVHHVYATGPGDAVDSDTIPVTCTAG